MKKIDLGQTITILANLGVIAGIVFLAVEVRQNQAVLERGNDMNLVAVQNAAQEQFSSFRKFLLENDDLYLIWMKGMRDAALTDIEQAKFDDLCAERIFTMATTHRVYDALDRGLDSQNAITTIRSSIAESRNFQACWERVRPVTERSGYFDFVEGVDAD